MRKKDAQLKAVEDLIGWDEINEEDQARVTQLLADFHDPDVDYPPKEDKKRKKKDQDEEDAEAKNDAEEKAEQPPAKKPTPRKALPEVEEETAEVDGKEAINALAVRLVARLRERGLAVADDDDAARKQIGGYVMTHKRGTTVDVAAVIRQADVDVGRRVHVDNVECPDNQGLANAFKELANYEFKVGDKFKGAAYSKVSAKIAEQTAPVTSGKEASKLPTIGKASAAKIDEFLASGKIEKLQDYRNST